MAVGVSFGGQSVSASETRGLFLKVFSGEVIKAYERAIKVSPLLTNRTITNGKSAQFPTTGVAKARYHVPGHSLLAVGSDASVDGNAYLSDILQSERVIHVDQLLTASCFIDQLDEAMSHYDYRSAFATELGRAIARHQDNAAIYQLFASAKGINITSGEETPGAAGGTSVDGDFYTDAASAVNTLYDASKTMDEKDVPREDRFVVMPPIAYYNLLKAGVLSIDMHATHDTRTMDGSVDGSAPRGETSGVRVAGMPIIVTNADGFTSSDAGVNDGVFFTDTKPQTADTNAEDDGMRNLASSGVPSGATGGSVVSGGTGLLALVCHKSAAGIVKLKDITMESEYMVERQGTLMVAKMAQGIGALRNDGAIAIIDD
tara:strand:- start:8613 stop:9734 length:1122 start_codon:yes stop_codon:yes gene_type:complete